MGQRNEAITAGKGSNRTPTAFWLVLAAAALARFWWLGRANLWQDEAGFMMLTRLDTTLSELFRTSRDYILSVGQLPFTFLVQHLYVRLLEGLIPDIARSAGWLRVPSVLWGVAAVWGVFRFTTLVADRSRAFAAALLFSFMFFPVHYSREVYCYAAVIAAAAWTAAWGLAYVLEPRAHWRVLAGSLLAALVLCFSHLSGTAFFGVLAAMMGVWWLQLWRRRDPISRRALAVIGVWLLVALAVLPTGFRFLFENKAHTGGADIPLWMILQDPVAKMFLGERPVTLVLSWMLFATGVLAALRRRGPAGWLAGCALLAWILIAVMTSRSQYISVRYFSPLAPLFCWLLAEALAVVATRIARVVRRVQPAQALYALTGTVLVFHAVWYLGPMYRLREKDVGFAPIAAWLNERLEPGTPFLMESAYELRWVSGYYPTPGLIGAAPYVHGGGPEEMARLHQRQQAFMLRFPEAPFIQSAHHNIDTPQGIWRWPHTHHARMDRLANEPLRDLVRRGMWIALPLQPVNDHTFSTFIYYSDREDLDRRARDQGAPARAEFPGWTVAQIAQGEYRRVLNASRGAIRLRPVAAIPTPVQVRMRAALDTERDEPVRIVIDGPGGVLHESIQPSRRWWEVELRIDPISQPVELRIRCEGMAGVRALLLEELRLAAAPGEVDAAQDVR
ncbi:MAG TPA: hypothetical protein PKE12_01165 [Kiritimatiellia bacterium]|nr:hypothetical protein [Kiritimatiellia bacterium]